MLGRVLLSLSCAFFCQDLAYGETSRNITQEDTRTFGFLFNKKEVEGNPTSFISIPIKPNSTYTPEDGDACTNQCSGTDPQYWCGGFKEDATGRVMRCVEHARYGDPCLGECGGKESYNWCLINAYQLGNHWTNQKPTETEWWDKCALQGHTVSREPCVGECEKYEHMGYWWCNTTSDWDYCSPPGLVKPVHLTVRGNECISECQTGNDREYHSCKKSRKFCHLGKTFCDCPDWSLSGNHWNCFGIGDSKDCNCDEHGDCDRCDCVWHQDCDDHREDCSPDDQHTRDNQTCAGPCESFKDYYRCKKEDGSWGNCSPKAQMGVHFSAKIELTVNGEKCRNPCALNGKDHYSCNVFGHHHADIQDYCSPSPDMTIYQDKCEDDCAARGESYYWCHTHHSWEKCSPAFDIVSNRGVSRANIHHPLS